MLWLSEYPAFSGAEPSWPTLPDTAMVLIAKNNPEALLLQEEAALIQNMGPSRVQDFTAGRHAARLAQKLLGLSEQPILQSKRVPIWPPGQCGSISHNRDFALAGVSTGLRGLGVDVESRGRVTQRLHKTLFRPDEEVSFSGAPTAAPDIAFSAKEAGYKALYPIGETFIGFQEASIHFDWPNCQFFIRYHGAHGLNRALESGIGYWRMTQDHIMTFFAIQD